MILEGAQWDPLPRPTGGPVQRVRVERADDHPAARSSAHAAPPGDAPSTDGPRPVEILAHEDDRAIIRLRHRAPGARAVAAQINGWWHPDPPDGLDLVAQGGGWFTGVFSVPGDLCSSIAFLEHHVDEEGHAADADDENLGEHAGERPGEHEADAARGAALDPPWWTEGLKVRRPGPSAPAPGGAGPVGSFVLDLVRDRIVPSPASSSLRLHELATAEGEPRTRWCTVGREDSRPPVDLPLLVVTDGEAHLERLDTPGMLAEAVRAGDLPPLLAVFLDAWPERARDLGVPGGQAAWIADTLVPRLRPEPDPHRTVITGSSFGGLTALFALARAPHRIGAAIAQSVSLWRYPHLALAAPLRVAIRGAGPEDVRIRLHAGHFEGTMGESARELADVVSTTTGAEIPVHLHRGGHDWAWWQPAMVQELSALLASESSRERPARPTGAPNYHGRSSASPEEGVP